MGKQGDGLINSILKKQEKGSVKIVSHTIVHLDLVGDMNEEVSRLIHSCQDLGHNCICIA